MSYYRHEYKHEITAADLLTLRARLGAVMARDPHARGGGYAIRSLYFDDLRDSALAEKISGVRVREKFRIRMYNMDTSYIILEKKCKQNNLCHKEQERLSREEVEAILAGTGHSLCTEGRPLLCELLRKMRQKGLRPKTIIDYLREPFVYPAGNVRVTLDSQIRTGLRSTDFFSGSAPTLPLPGAPIILEVKWDEYLPDIIRSAVSLPHCRTAAFSKYAYARIYE